VIVTGGAAQTGCFKARLLSSLHSLAESSDSPLKNTLKRFHFEESVIAPTRVPGHSPSPPFNTRHQYGAWAPWIGGEIEILIYFFKSFVASLFLFLTPPFPA
jgi:hypothetical protein